MKEEKAKETWWRKLGPQAPVEEASAMKGSWPVINWQVSRTLHAPS